MSNVRFFGTLYSDDTHATGKGYASIEMTRDEDGCLVIQDLVVLDGSQIRGEIKIHTDGLITIEENLRNDYQRIYNTRKESFKFPEVSEYFRGKYVELQARRSLLQATGEAAMDETTTQELLWKCTRLRDDYLPKHKKAGGRGGGV